MLIKRLRMQPFYFEKNYDVFIIEVCDFTFLS